MRGTRTWAKMFRYCQIKLNGSVVAQGEGRRAQGAGRRAQKQPALSWFRLISADFDKLNNQLNHRTKGTTACPELVEGNKNQQTTNNEQRTTNNEQRTTNNEQRTTNNEQRTTNNEQRTTNNEQQTNLYRLFAL
ncbi:MAG: hypothetical protein WC271_06150 [Bacteroidales bacterium]